MSGSAELAEKPVPTTRPSFALLLSMGVMALAAYMRWPWRIFPIGYDESVWAYIAQQTLRGSFVPYRDIVDNKPPLVYLPFFASEALGVRSDIALRTFGLAYQVAVVGLLVFVLCRVLGPTAAIVAGTAEAVFGATPYLEGYLLQSEMQLEWVLVLILLVGWHIRKSGPQWMGGFAPAILGVLSAAAFLLRQTHALLMLPLLFLTMSASRPGRRWVAAVQYVLGFAVPVGAILVLYAAVNALPQLFQGVVLHNFRHVVAAPTWGRLFQKLRGNVFHNQMPLILAALAGGVFAVVRSTTRTAALLSWCFFIVGAAGLVAGGDRMFLHYFLLLAFPLHLLLACGVAAFSQRLRFAAAAGALIFVTARAPAERRYPAEIFHLAPVPTDREPIAYLDSHRKGDEVVFFEWQHYYYRTGIRAPHRYITTDHLGLPGYEAERDEVLKVLDTRPPTWIVTRPGTSPRDWGLAGILASGYIKVFEWPNGAVYRTTGEWRQVTNVKPFVEQGSSALRVATVRSANPDIIWRNYTTGQNAIWYMNGTSVTGGGAFSSAPTNWSIVGVGDFNGDGKPDIVWRNTVTGEDAIWYMDGLSVIGGGAFGSAPTNWSIVGVGDFNGDGKPDIVWRNCTAGENAIWYMNGLTVTGGGAFGSAPLSWSTVGVGDFNRDGNPDIVWRNYTTGENAIWYMNGLTVTGGGAFSSAPTSWSIVAVGDFNGDGKPDVVWRNTVTGEDAIWYMGGAGGTTVLGGGPFASAPTSWSIVGPK